MKDEQGRFVIRGSPDTRVPMPVSNAQSAMKIESTSVRPDIQSMSVIQAYGTTPASCVSDMVRGAKRCSALTRAGTGTVHRH